MCVLCYSEYTKTHGTRHILVSACFIVLTPFGGQIINNQEGIIKQIYDYSNNNNNNNNNDHDDDDNDDSGLIIIKVGRV